MQLAQQHVVTVLMAVEMDAAAGVAVDVQIHVELGLGLVADVVTLAAATVVVDAIQVAAPSAMELALELV